MTQLSSVTTADFGEQVIAASDSQPVLVDFWAPWCGPCRMLGPVLEQIATEFAQQLRVVKLNTDEEPQIAGQYAIRSIPAVKLFKGGLVVDEFVGAQPAAAIRQFLAPHVAGGPATDPRIEAAVAEARAGRPADALQMLDALPPPMQSEPALLEARAIAHFTSVRMAPDETDVIQSARVRAARHLLAGEAGPGIETLLAAMERNGRFARDQGRRDLLLAFDLAHAEPELVSAARRRLARLIH